MSLSFLESNQPSGSNINLVVINCAINSTLQDVKVRPGSGVYSYVDSGDYQSMAANRSIVWRTFDDVLELQEYSLDRNLHGSMLKIQFKNTLIIPNGVSAHETTDHVYILVTTLVSAHRLVFRHPSKLFSDLKSTTEPSIGGHLSIFHRDFLRDFDNPVNYVQLPTSSQSGISGPTSIYMACCSWVNTSLDAYFGVCTGVGTLHVLKLPAMHLAKTVGGETAVAKIITFDLKQNSFIGKLITGFVPSIMKSSTSSATNNAPETAVSMFSHSTHDDELIFALCRDACIRVLSLKRQEVIHTHNIFTSETGGIKQNSAILSIPQNVISMKPWFMKIADEQEDWQERASLNIIVHWSHQGYKVFTLLRVNMPEVDELKMQQRRNHLNTSNSFFLSSASQEGSEANGGNGGTQLVKTVEIYAPSGDFELLDYFIADQHLWALWQFNDNVNLQYFSFMPESDQSGSTDMASVANDWVVVVNDATSAPQMSLKSSTLNAKEYYLEEIFWRGHFSLSAIGKAICVLNRWPEHKLSEAKIDTLVAEAIKLTDAMIRNQFENIELLSVDDYSRMELDSWHQLYLFCLEYYFNETKPMSIFVDHNTGVKGIVRRATLEIVPDLEPLDDLIGHYFLLCKETNGESADAAKNTASTNLFSDEALRSRLLAFMAPIQASVRGVFPSSLESSIYHLLLGMAAINRALKDEDWANFDSFMRRINNCSIKMNFSLVELAKEITEDPEIRQLHDHSLDPFVSDFFDKCPLVGEAIEFLLHHASYDFGATPFQPAVDHFGASHSSEKNLRPAGRQEAQLNIADAMQYEITPEFFNFLFSSHGLEFVARNVRKLVDGRYRFVRDMFLFQFMLSKFRMNLKSEDTPKIALIEASFIPKTAQLLFALDYVSWVTHTPMVTANVAWAFTDAAPSELKANITSIVDIKSSPGQASAGSAPFATSSGKASLRDNSELLAVLDMRDYLDLARLSGVDDESTFYQAYPTSSILHFFIRFRGGLLVRRILSYQCAAAAAQNGGQPTPAFSSWSSLMSIYLNATAQLLWPYSHAQLKVAEFLLGVAQLDLLEQYVLRLHNWCPTFLYARFFLKGVCHLVDGQGAKALRQFKQALPGIHHYEPFLFRIFAQKPAKPNKKSEERTATTSKVLPNARTIFRYYNKLVQLFNRYSSPDHVIDLVDIALDTLNPDNDPEYGEHRNSLLITLFANHLKLGNVVRAHQAMIDNTDTDQRRTCLRQFILALCERRQIGQLVRFSYQGLEEEFVTILESKAKGSMVVVVSKMEDNKFNDGEDGAPINYYHILYAYFIQVNQYQRAAQAMYNYYRRLVPETEVANAESMLEMQTHALLAARNCLALVGEENAFVVEKVAREDEGKKRKHNQTELDEIRSPQPEQNKEETFSRDWLLSQFQLISIRLSLYRRDRREYALATTRLTPEETQMLAVGAGQYEQAFKLAHHFPQLPLEPIFEGMAAKYVHLLHHESYYSRYRLDDNLFESLANLKMDDQQAEDVKKVGHSRGEAEELLEVLDLFYDNECDEDGDGGSNAFIAYNTSMSICDRMWSLIMFYLRRYERAPRKSSRLLRSVAEKLLANGVELPPSLFKIYQRANCAELLRLLLTYNFLQAATRLAIDYMQAMMGHCWNQFDLTHYLTPNCPPLYMPIHLFDCLIDILREEMEQAKLESRASGLYIGSKFSDDGTRSIGDNDDDDDKQDKIDYVELHHRANKARKMLQETIESCSKIY